MVIPFILAFLLGIVVGGALVIMLGAYQHDKELREAASNPDPKYLSELAAYVVEYQNIKELEEK